MSERKFTTIQIPLESGVLERLKTFRDSVEKQSDIPGVKVPLYAAIDIAVRDATTIRNQSSSEGSN